MECNQISLNSNLETYNQKYFEKFNLNFILTSYNKVYM